MDVPFCRNCGKEVQSDASICPSCGQSIGTPQPAPPVVHAPYKDPAVAAVIAIVGGIFGLPGIGHIYVGKLGKGIAILVVGLVVVVGGSFALGLGIIFADSSLFERDSDLSPATLSALIVGIVVVAIAYIVFLIWQTLDARKLAREFNEHVRTTGREPW